MEEVKYTALLRQQQQRQRGNGVGIGDATAGDGDFAASTADGADGNGAPRDAEEIVGDLNMGLLSRPGIAGAARTWFASSNAEAVVVFVVLISSLMVWAYMQEAIMTRDWSHGGGSGGPEWFKYALLLVAVNRFVSACSAALVLTASRVRMFPAPVPLSMVAAASLSNVLATACQVRLRDCDCRRVSRSGRMRQP